MLSYKPFFDTLTRKGVTIYQLLKNGIDPKTITRLKRNQNITLTTIGKLCEILECEIQDIVKYEKEKSND